MKKRVLAALLALVMLFGALPMSVFAVDEDLNTYADDIEAENEDVGGSNGSTAPTGKPAALSATHYFTLNCNTPGCTAHSESRLMTIFGNMYHRVDTGDESVYTIEFDLDEVEAELPANHKLRTARTDYKIDPMRITWKWEDGEWKGTGTACDNTGWPFYVYANVESTASSGTDEPGDKTPDLDDMGVLVWCIGKEDGSEDGHKTKKITYKLNALSYTGSAKKQGETWKYSVTIDWDSILDKFNTTGVGVNHKKSRAYPKDGTITWTWKNSAWELDETHEVDGINYLALMRVLYDDSAAVPDHPDDLEQYKLYFRFVCTDSTHKHNGGYSDELGTLTILYGANSTYGLWDATKTEDTYTVTINKAGLEKYMAMSGNGMNTANHKVETIAPATLEWKLKNNAWVYQGEKTEYKGEKAIVVNVNAKAEVVEAPVPTEELLSKGSFSIASVYCGYDVNDTTHAPYEMRCDATNYIKGSFVENSAVKNADGTYTVQIRTAPYVDYFNQRYVGYNCPHEAKTETVSVTLAYTPDGKLSEWQVVTVNGEMQRADIPVYCEKAPDAPSITLTYNANAPEGKTVTNLPKPQTESGSRVVTFQLSWAIPACEGYKFLGWTTDRNSNNPTFPVENLGTANWVSTTGNPNYILYAVWEKNPFHVTYRLKDENGKWVNAYEEDVPVAGCENHTLWTPAEKTGYKFTGWYQKAEDIGKKGEVTKLFDKTWVLYGDYIPVEYTITYDYRDKDIADKNLYPENAETYTIEDTVTLNPITNKGMFGKTFLEWRCDLNKDGVAEKITEIPAGTTGNLTVYAYWNYPVSYTVYDEDGNEVEAYCETINVPEDSFGANLKPKSVEKDGYEFDGWYQNPKNFGNPNKRTETLDNAKNWKLYGKLKYLEKPVYVYVQPTYKGIALTKSDAKAVAALARLGFTEGFNAGGKFVTLGKMMTAKTDVAGMVDEIDNGKLALYSEIDTTKFNEHVLNSIGWYSENALTLVTNTTHKGYEADGKIDAYHLNGTMSFQSVTFDAGTNDKVENMPADGYYLVNDRITLSAPTREGYTFLGWSAAQDTPVITANPETDGETLYPADHEWTVIGDVTFTAKWQANTYTLCTTLKLNGSDKAYEVPGRGYSWTYRESGEKDTDINYESFKNALAAKAREIDAANTPSEKQIDIVFSVGKIADFEKEIKKYGQEGVTWQPKNNNTAYVSASVYTYYDVTFMDGDTTLDTQTVKYGEKLAAFDEPTKDGYKFLGWFTQAGEAFDLNTPITKSMTLTAKWERNTYTIIYHGNGGVKVKGDKTYEQVTSAKLPIGEPTTLKSAEFTRDNYRFLGWSYFENGSVYFKAAEKNVIFEESDIDENGNVHLYAIWKRLSYPVTLRYNANTTDEVTNMPEPLEQTKDSDETGNAEFNISGMIPARAGYRFLGWAVNKPDAAEDDIRFKAGEPSIFVVNYQDDITLYAVWQELYTVTYSYDPSLPAEVQATIPKDPDTYTVGQKVTTAAKPNSVRVGENIWTFKTWKLDGVEVAPNTQVEMVSGGLHFEGIWETKLIHYSLTIQYVDKKGKELAESHMDLLSKGEAYKVDSPKIKGYKLKDKDKAVIEGTMPGRNLTIEVVYIKKSTGGGSGTIDSPNKPTTKAPALTLNTDDHFAFINGYPDGSVQPEGNVTRAETAAILYRIMGDACQSYYKTNSSSYSDVARGDWYNTYVATLENAGVIVDTRTNGKFRPNDAITRAELASMIAQFAGLESASAAKFNDVGSRYWAAEEIAIAAKMGWINGYPDGSFRPDRNVTRAELMAMVNRALGRTPKSADDLLSGMKTWRDNANVNAWYYLDVQEATNDHTYTKSGTHETWKKLL